MRSSFLPFRFFLTLCTLVASSLPMAGFSGNLEAYSSEQQPSFTLPDLKDNIHSLSDYKDKVVLVNFWASWCPPCIHEMPALKKLKQSYADKAFEILTLNVAEKKYKVRKFSKMIKLDLPILLDTSSETFDRWGVKTLPTSFLIDASGSIRYRVFGNPGWDSTEALTIIDQLLTEKTKTKETRQ